MDTATNKIIEVKGAYKSYDSRTKIFKGLNMTVEKGTIYALLGPSGCGKTTLLKCIVGIKSLDAGTITLKIKKRTDIGYMPQDIALVQEITIKETLSYYGWIYNFPGDKLEQRKKYLFGVLNMPSQNSKINELSGGQKRRVSLCIALLHDPELLILDEPTVGIDPILRSSIWAYLVEISSMQKKTIILTTHYNEEARHSNKVGMMRGGVLVAEGVASSIMHEFNCNTLEEVFVLLSDKQEAGYAMGEENISSSDIKPNIPLKKEKMISMNRCIGYFLKNFHYLKYSSLAWFLMFFIPITTCLLSEYTLGRKPRDQIIGVVNEELDRYNDCTKFSNISCFPASCIYLSLFHEKSIILRPMKSVDIAQVKMATGNIEAIIHISKNFTKALTERIWMTMNSEDRALEQSQISVWIEPSNKVIRDYLESDIYETFLEFLDKLALKCEWIVDHAKIPIKFNAPVYGNSKAEFNEFATPGIFLILEFFIPIGYVIPILQDKAQGIIERSLITGVSILDIIVAYVAISMIIFFILTACNMVILYGIFGHVFEGSTLIAMCLVCLVGINGMSFGLAVSVAFDDFLAATYFVVGVLITTMTLGGFAWTPEGMHETLKSVNWMLPLTPATSAYRSITARLWTWSHPVVYHGFLSLTSWILISCFVTYLIIKIRKT